MNMIVPRIDHTRPQRTSDNSHSAIKSDTLQVSQTEYPFDAVLRQLNVNANKTLSVEPPLENIAEVLTVPIFLSRFPLEGKVTLASIPPTLAQNTV